MKKLASPEMTENFSYLIKLLACILNDDKPPKPTGNTDWALVVYIAQCHSVAGMLSYVIPRLDAEDRPPEELIDRLYEIQNTELLYDVNRDFETERLFNVFKSHRLYCVAVKGYHVKHCYPYPSMRTMSDIDVLYKVSQHKAVRNLFETEGYTVVYDRLIEFDFTKEPFHHYEFHSILSDGIAGEDYYSDIWDRIKFDKDGYIGRLSVEDEYIYLLVHLADHLNYGGAGLRMIMDLYAYRKYYADSLNNEYISSEVSKLKLERFRERVEALADNWFSGEVPDTDSLISDHILCSATFGNTENAIMLNWIMSEKQTGKKHSAFYRFFHKLFPSYKYILNRYPSARGKRMLYLFYVIRYWCCRLFVERNINTKSFGHYAKGTDSEAADRTRLVLKEFGFDYT